MIKIVFMILLMNSVPKAEDDFELKIYNKEEKFRLSTIIRDKKKIVINFFASWCPPCVKEVPELEALKKTAQDSSKYLFIAINAGEKKAKIKKFIQKTKFSYLILEDPERSFSKQWGITALPRTIILNNAGKRIYDSNVPPKNLD